MVTDDLDCEAPAAELVNRARDEELVLAHLKATLPSMQAIAAAISKLADRGAGKPRRSRTFRLTRGEDGEPVADEVTDQPEPAEQNSAEAPPVDEEPAKVPESTPGGSFSDVFGDPLC